MKPLIAVTPDLSQTSQRIGSRHSQCGVAYTDAIEEAGGVPLIIPLTGRRSTLDTLFGECAGLLLIGGGDVCHSFYEPKMPAKQRALIQGMDRVHDEMEIHLIKLAMRRKRPIFGICRGVQVLNVALGGTLIPDIPGHRNPVPDALGQAIQWEADSAMRKLLGTDCLKVNSSHHQALDRVAKRLRVVARAKDGMIEAVEHTSAPFVWGVQFHPERLVKTEPRVRRLFRAFVEAAKR